MGIREFKLPGDLDVMTDLVNRGFQYPDHPEWSQSEDDIQSLKDIAKNLKRMFPILAVFGLIAPQLQDSMRGFIWEEDQKPVGLVNVMRQSNKDEWLIGNVAVLPDYRGRGYARKLVEAAIDLTRKKNARIVRLDVIAANLPAYKLYTSLGFDHFNSSYDLLFEHGTGNENPKASMELPAGIEITPIPFFEWQDRYTLAARITPESAQKYAPVTERRFKVPLPLRPISLMFMRFAGVKTQLFVVRTSPENSSEPGKVVAVIGYNARIKAGGKNFMRVTLDPDCDNLAPALVNYLLNALQTEAPDRDIEMAIPGWMPAVKDAATSAGFKVLYEGHSLGMTLKYT